MPLHIRLFLSLVALAYAREYLSLKKIKRIHHIFPFRLEKFPPIFHGAAVKFPKTVNVCCLFPHITDYVFINIPAAAFLS
jgi:hypothetical protein